jgi:RHS repeat-associated protein
LPGGVRNSWKRDGIGRPVMQTVGHTANNVFNTRKRKQYVWEVNDRLKQIKDEKGITSFEHDGWSNLAKTIYPDGEVQLRNPDAVGNLFKTIDRKDREYGKGGQLKKANGWQYEYDAEGHLIRKEHVSGDVWKYEWNDAGMLTRVTRPDKEEVSFSYDALGRRLSKQFKNTITKFVWDGNVPLHEWKENAVTGKVLGSLEINEDGDLSGSLNSGLEDSFSSPSGQSSETKIGNEVRGGAVTWLFDTDSFAPAAKIKNGKIYSIVTDHLGTPGQMYKEDGELFWEAELDSYGKVRVEKGELSSCPFRYQGQYEDVETGLYYNRFRYYSAEEGMYVSQDPIGLKGGLTVLYSYVKDTNIWIDEFGLASSSYPNIGGPLHHIATNKNEKRGKKWTNKFKPFFDNAGLDMDGADNKVYVPGHKGPHSDDYHQHVYDKLQAATNGIDHTKDKQKYQQAVKDALADIAKDAQTPGTRVNDLLIKK